jgi:SPP1 gp7 family putative phage head morphogenesis protein
MVQRFTELARVVRKAVDEKDCFGLKEKPLHSFQMTTPMDRAFAFTRSQEKLVEFIRWLERQVEAGILTVREMKQVGTSIDALWTNMYIADSYKRGLIRARYEMLKAGYKVPSIDDTGGIEMSMSTPFHLERIGLLFTRAFSELKGITDAMSSVISRVLAQGLADGDGPRFLARKLVAVIDGENLGDLGLTDVLGRYISPQRRAEILARTEIIRAHHVATIQEYRNWGVVGVNVKAEWMTAGDSRVCQKCAELQGKVFTLDEIEGMIPRHPQCRCIALPWSEELLQYEK